MPTPTRTVPDNEAAGGAPVHERRHALPHVPPLVPFFVPGAPVDRLTAAPGPTPPLTG